MPFPTNNIDLESGINAKKSSEQPWKVVEYGPHDLWRRMIPSHEVHASQNENNVLKRLDMYTLCTQLNHPNHNCAMLLRMG